MGDPVTTMAIIKMVTPIALATIPAVWKQIVKVLKGMQRNQDHTHDTRFEFIVGILDTLERMPDLSLTESSHIQSHLSKLKLETDSLGRMMANDNKILHWPGEKRKIDKKIQSIELSLQLMLSTMHMRPANITGVQHNAEHDRLDLPGYEEHQKNLYTYLLRTLREDILEPVIHSEENRALIERSGVYPEIKYVFQAQSGPGSVRTLTTTRGVRLCIEELLKHLKFLQTTIRAGGSSLLGVALFESFTETLPKALTEYRRSTLNPETAHQLNANLKFFRSFPASPTFTAIQGQHGLQLEDEDKICLDLQDRRWVTWNNVYSREFANNRPLALEEGTSSGGASSATSGSTASIDCVFCGLLLETDSIQRTHWDVCVKREESYHRRAARATRELVNCPVCSADMRGWSDEARQSHANACVDRNQVSTWQN